MKIKHYISALGNINSETLCEVRDQFGKAWTEHHTVAELRDYLASGDDWTRYESMTPLEVVTELAQRGIRVSIIEGK